MKEFFGRFLCWIGLHDWYEGFTKVYCLRCGDVLHYLSTANDEDDD